MWRSLPHLTAFTWLWPAHLLLGRTAVIQTPELGARIMRYELADFEWTAIKPMLPNKPRGVPRVNDRRVRMASSGSSDQEHPGVICRRRSAQTPLATIDSSARGEQVSGAAS